jgi:LuxR family maltose regulon positive regulatory protein
LYNDFVSELLPTKFYFPPVPAGFVARPRLMEKLDEALTRRLTLVSALPGAGKTALVSAWVHSARKKGTSFGWLSLDNADNDPVRFLEYLAACLEEGGTVIDIHILAGGPVQHLQLEELLGEFIRGLMELRQDVVLVLDDYHLIQNKQVHVALQYILDHAPERLHLLLLTRSDPPLELARLRVAGQLGELRMEHLRFSVQEACLFLRNSTGMDLADEAVNSLNARTEGWIAGLQMAAISLRGAADTSAFIVAFAGSHRYVFDYLIEQVLDRQAAEVREFLLRTSVLERLCGPLCDEVAGTAGSAGHLLNQIEHGNLFLMPLDDEHGWYRYHQLFVDLLRLVLDQTHPGLKVELHHLACHWYESHGLLAEALHHGLAAGDTELVARILSENVLALVDHAEIVPVLAQIEAISPEQRASQPWLEVAYAWGLAYLGRNDRAEVALDLAEQQLNALEADKRDKMSGHIAAVRAYITWTNGARTDEAVAYAEKAAGLLPVEEQAVRALNLTTLGNALGQKMDTLPSAEALEQAYQLAEQAEQTHVLMQAASGLAFTYMLMGKFRQSQAVCEKALAYAETIQRQDARPLTASASVYAVLARTWLEAGEFEKSLQVARKGMDLSEMWGQLDTIMMAAQPLIYSLAITNQLESAREVLRRVRKMAQKGPPWHLDTVDFVELQIYLDSDPQDEAEIEQEAARLLRVFEFSPLVEARVLIKQNRLAEAQALLEREQAIVAGQGNFTKCWILALKALAYFQNKDQRNAMVALEQAFQIAGPDNMVFTFVREGAAMEKFLRLAQGKTKAAGFVRKILAVFEARRKAGPGPIPATEALIEPLSERELEVLQHLNSYLSTPEIADLLVVSANTVRTHIKNIYAKLGVHGRSGAIRRAGELGLLSWQPPAVYS